MTPAASPSIRVDVRSKTPVYLQIVEQVQALTAAGVLKPGDRLPTLRQMAAEAQINFNTVARAYHVLDAAGVISTHHGRGTYAVAPPPSARARKARAQALDTLARDTVEAAARLGCAPEEVLAAVERAAGLAAGVPLRRRVRGRPS